MEKNINENIGISIFEIMDYMYCPRTIYYENVLKISKNINFEEEEEKRKIEISHIKKKWIWERLKVKNDKYNFGEENKVEVERNKEFQKSSNPLTKTI